MGSRYNGESPRWDRERFEREDRYRGPPVMERERVEYEKDRYSRGGRGFQDRYLAEERYGPPARRPERTYYEEDEIIARRGPPAGDAMIPYRPRREEAPPRPGLLRRQSSLDTFDRRPQRRYNDYDYRPPPIPVPLPPRRPSPPRYRPRMAERDYEEIRVAEPDYYGDEEYRTYKEREWTNRRMRRRSNDSEVREREEEEEEEVVGEAPWPRKGKTKMPRGKVHTRAVIELGYPYEEEGETIILLKALNKAQIDEVIALSQEFREKEAVTTTTTIHVIEPGEDVIEKIEKVTHVPMSEAPRSVREWDTLKVEEREHSPTRTHKSHKSRSTRHRSHSHSHYSSRRGSSPETVIEKKSVREVSPSTTHRTRASSRSRATSRSRRESSPGTTIVEERKIIRIDDADESNSVHAGPLALVTPRRKTDRELREEIRELEMERRVLRTERGTRDREVIIERRASPVQEVVEVRKDKKAPPPDPRIIRAMMKTLT